MKVYFSYMMGVDESIERLSHSLYAMLSGNHFYHGKI